MIEGGDKTPENRRRFFIATGQGGGKTMRAIRALAVFARENADAKIIVVGRLNKMGVSLGGPIPEGACAACREPLGENPQKVAIDETDPLFVCQRCVREGIVEKGLAMGEVISQIVEQKMAGPRQCWCRGLRSRQVKHRREGKRGLTEEAINEIIVHCPCCEGTGYCTSESGCGLDAVDYDRASGEVECKKCKKLYREHPFAKGLDGYDGPFLHELCDGALVKL